MGAIERKAEAVEKGTSANRADHDFALICAFERQLGAEGIYPDSRAYDTAMRVLRAALAAL